MTVEDLPESVVELDELDPETALGILCFDYDEDEGPDIRGLQFNVAVGLYFFCHHYHGGQFTRLYQIGSCMGQPPILFDPGAIGDIDEAEEGDQFAYALLENWWNAHGEEFDDSLKGGGIEGALTPRARF